MDEYHSPVLLKEVIANLNIKNKGWYIDGTLGGGSYSLEIIRHGGRVLAFDVDDEAIRYVEKRLTEEERKRIEIVKRNFSEVEEVAREKNINNVQGIVLDLGVSRHQLVSEERGFSFRSEEKLDMRMNLSSNFSAIDILNKSSNQKLYEIFTKNGEEKRAWAISDAIVRARSIEEIVTVKRLIEILESVLGRGDRAKSSIAKIFQAIRIEVNDELGNLRRVIPSGVKLLASGGRFEIISYHSLEDRIVKINFLNFEKAKEVLMISRKPILASDEEVKKNYSARSAKLRIVEKI